MRGEAEPLGILSICLSSTYFWNYYRSSTLQNCRNWLNCHGKLKSESRQSRREDGCERMKNKLEAVKVRGSHDGLELALVSHHL